MSKSIQFKFKSKGSFMPLREAQEALEIYMAQGSQEQLITVNEHSFLCKQKNFGITIAETLKAEPVNIERETEILVVNIAASVRRARICRGLTKVALAKMSGLSRIQIHEIEQAKTNGLPRLSSILALSKALKISPEEMLKGPQE